MNIGVALTCIQCNSNGQLGLCSNANDGTSIDCDQGFCTAIECTKPGNQDIIGKFCGVPTKIMGIEMSNVTKVEQCDTQV